MQSDFGEVTKVLEVITGPGEMLPDRGAEQVYPYLQFRADGDQQMVE